MPRMVPPNPWAAYGQTDMPPVREIQAALLQPGGGSVRAAQSKVVRRRRPFLPLQKSHSPNEHKHFFLVF